MPKGATKRLKNINAIQTGKQEISEKEYSLSISQTEQKLKRDNMQTEKDACNTHNKIRKRKQEKFIKTIKFYTCNYE